MFFSITTCQDHRFPHSRQFDQLWVNYDSGWQYESGKFYKGYNNNYCRITVTETGIDLEHSDYRSFPLWFDHGLITNLCPDSGKRAWASDHLHMMPNGTIVWTPIELNLAVPEQSLSINQAQQQIRSHLDAAVADLDQPVKLFCSGGLDTFLIYSMLTYHDCAFELLQTDHFEDDTFVEHNCAVLHRHWSYKPTQLHHWTRPTWLATGGCGDEYFLRGPAVIAMITAWHNVDFGSLLQQNPGLYHYHHFAKYESLWQTSWQQRHKLQEQYATRDALNRQIMDTLANDHQHWHLGETVTWTPFKNIEIARTLLQCDIVDLLPQFLDGSVTKNIIADYCPEVLQFVSTHKNHNTHEHMTEFFRWHYD